MDVIKWVLAAFMAVGVGIGGGALSVAVVELIWPADGSLAGKPEASHAIVVKGDRLDRADITCWSANGKAMKCR